MTHDYTGLTKKPAQHPWVVEIVACPLCEGYGGWIRGIDYKGRPSVQPCPQCIEWGWVAAGSTDATCIHEFVELSPAEVVAMGKTHYGACDHWYKCKCGKVRNEDSSG